MSCTQNGLWIHQQIPSSESYTDLDFLSYNKSKVIFKLINCMCMSWFDTSDDKKIKIPPNVWYIFTSIFVYFCIVNKQSDINKFCFLLFLDFISLYTKPLLKFQFLRGWKYQIDSCTYSQVLHTIYMKTRRRKMLTCMPKA